MPVGLLGRKIGMTQVYEADGTAVPVTVIEAGPCTVLQVRTKERDGYEAIQLGFADKPRRLATKPERGHVAEIESKRSKGREEEREARVKKLAEKQTEGQAESVTRPTTEREPLPKANCEPKRFIREFREEEPAGFATWEQAYHAQIAAKKKREAEQAEQAKREAEAKAKQAGADKPKEEAPEPPKPPEESSAKPAEQKDQIEQKEAVLVPGRVFTVDVFQNIPAVDVIGTSKGKGTAGPMKRHNFHGLPASHGVKRKHRSPGSVGSSADPARVFKGTGMAGRMGAARSTVRNLTVVRIDAENNLLVVRGGVPGPNGGYLMIRKTNQLRRRAAPAEESEATGKKEAGKKQAAKKPAAKK